MNMKLGEKIRSLRKQKNISQEVLAQYLGVSFQAVSKWENGDNLPDVTMIPAIAIFFEVSTDELFDFNRLETENKVQQSCWNIAEYRYSQPEKAEEDLRALLKQYPGNEIILNNLIYSLQINKKHHEVIEICKALIESTRYDDVKYDAARILAKTYRETGQQDLVKPTLELIPEIYFSKLELAANLLDGEEAMEAARQHASLSRDDLLDMLSRMSQLFRLQGDTVQAEQYAELTRAVYQLFEGRRDDLGYSGREPVWLQEEVWPCLQE